MKNGEDETIWTWFYNVNKVTESGHYARIAKYEVE
jgi:hypothetical protein